MRSLKILLALLLIPSLAFAVTVYKAEDDNGVITMSDRPIKDGIHQETIQLENIIETGRLAHLKTYNEPLHSTRAISKDAPVDIKLAQNDLEKAQYQLTTARVQQLKALRECKAHLRLWQKAKTHCPALDISQEETQLAEAQTQLDALLDKNQNIG